MQVFLIHGMGRTPISMWLLAHRLRRAGYQPHLFGYSVALTPLETIAARFAQHVSAHLAGGSEAGQPTPGDEPEGQAYAVVGHSLGNVITRLAADRLPPGLCCFAMLAPPNHSPTLARRMAGNPLFRLMAGDAGRRLADPQFFERLAVPDVPTLIIAGTAGPRGQRLPFGKATNDGIVSLAESRLGAVPVVAVPAIHTFLMNRRDVTRAVLDFLAHPRPTPGRAKSGS